MNHAEFYALLLFATAGMLMMAGSNELIMVFLGLEILSIATYVLGRFSQNGSEIERIRAEILPAGIVLFGILSLWRGTDLWRHRQHEPARRSRKSLRCSVDSDRVWFIFRPH